MQAVFCEGRAHTPRSAIQPLVQSQGQSRQFHAPGFAGDDSAKESFFPGTWIELFLNISHFNGKSRRMNSHRAAIAGHAGKTTIHLFDQVRAELHFAFQPLAGQSHTPARGEAVSLRNSAIRRADRQTEAAANAVQVFKFGRASSNLWNAQVNPCFDDEPFTLVNGPSSIVCLYPDLADLHRPVFLQ